MKMLLMNDYKRKDELLAKWHRQLTHQGMERDAWSSRFTLLEADTFGAALSQLLHGIVKAAMAVYFRCVETLLMWFILTFLAVSSCHTFGWFMNASSMESVPFETGIKATIALISDKSKLLGNKMDASSSKPKKS